MYDDDSRGLESPDRPSGQSRADSPRADDAPDYGTRLEFLASLQRRLLEDVAADRRLDGDARLKTKRHLREVGAELEQARIALIGLEAAVGDRSVTGPEDALHRRRDRDGGDADA